MHEENAYHAWEQGYRAAIDDRRNAADGTPGREFASNPYSCGEDEPDAPKIYEVLAAPDCKVDALGFVRGYWSIRVQDKDGDHLYARTADRECVAGAAIDVLSEWHDGIDRDSFAVTVTYLDRVPESWRGESCTPSV